MGGRLILRIEDLDSGRVRPGAAEAALTDLRWLGLDWDDGPDLAAALLRRISNQSGGTATTTPSPDSEPWDWSTHAPAPGPTSNALLPPPTPRTKDPPTRESAPLGRARTPTCSATVRSPGDSGFLPARSAGLIGSWANGRSTLDASVATSWWTVGSRSLLSACGGPRRRHDGRDSGHPGDDLVPSTPRQILLYRALGWEPPSFGHVPLAVGSDGRRLAKRDGSLKLAALRDQGVDSARLVGTIARSCGWSDRIEPEDAPSLIERFDLATIPRSPWVITPEFITELTGLIAAVPFGRPTPHLGLRGPRESSRESPERRDDPRLPSEFRRRESAQSGSKPQAPPALAGFGACGGAGSIRGSPRFATFRAER